MEGRPSGTQGGCILAVTLQESKHTASPAQTWAGSGGKGDAGRGRGGHGLSSAELLKGK